MHRSIFILLLVAGYMEKAHGQADTLSASDVRQGAIADDRDRAPRGSDLVKAIVPVVPAVDTGWVPPKVKKVRGQVEAGGGHGPLPYSADVQKPWNAYARGELGMDVVGMPLKVTFDLGTDIPQRGPRNRIRLMVDRDRLVERVRWKQADTLQHVHAQLDSLKDVRAAMRRELNGIGSQRAGLSMDGLPVAPSAPSLSDTLPPVPDGLIGGVPQHEHQLDSLRDREAGIERSLRSIEERIAALERLEQRQASVVNASQEGESMFQGLLSGIKRLEVGSCSPGRSEFLIDGVDMQGVSLQYERNNVLLSFDRGRVLDETWRTDAASERLRRLNESLFLADVSDLSPRQLTVVRAGLGTFAGSHVIVGYLSGRRTIQPPGMFPIDPSAGKEVNQVLEADMAYVVNEHHTVRLVVASSILDTRTPGAEEAVRPTTSDLFRVDEDADHAAKVIWSSSFDRTRTSVEVEGRTVSSDFQSFGLGFLRSGAKAVETRVSQQVGKKVRLRFRGTREVRDGLGAAPSSTLSRGQLRSDYRVSRLLTLRASVMPVLVVVGASEGSLRSVSTLTGLGGDLRKRWKTWSTTLSADLGRYGWRGPDGPAQQATHVTAGLGFGDEHWSARLGWASLLDGSDSTASKTQDLSFQLDRRCASGAHFGGSIHVPTDERTGWTMSISFPLSNGFSITGLIENYPQFLLLFNTDDPDKNNDTYHWSIGLACKW